MNTSATCWHSHCAIKSICDAQLRCTQRIMQVSSIKTTHIQPALPFSFFFNASKAHNAKQAKFYRDAFLSAHLTLRNFFDPCKHNKCGLHRGKRREKILMSINNFIGRSFDVTVLIWSRILVCLVIFSLLKFQGAFVKSKSFESFFFICLGRS